jgi:hypothetical protein|nr:MAG TPA: hypothetical protein [Caudoviricetes sp.]
MTLAKNNPLDLMWNDPDFRAAMWNTEKRRFIRGKCSVENSTGTMPAWTVFCRVLGWHIEDDTLVIELEGAVS